MRQLLGDLFCLVTFQATWAQGGLFITVKDNEIRPGLFAEFHLNRDSVVSFDEVSIPVTVIPGDPYNPGRASMSVYPACMFGGLIVTSILTGGGGRSEWFPRSGAISDSTFLWYFFKYVAKALLVANSEYHFQIGSPDSGQTSVFLQSLFLGLQTDYFIRDRNWFRLSPALGIQVAAVLPKEGTQSDLMAQVGIDVPWDFGNHVSHKGPIRGFAGIKVSLLK